MSLGCSDNYQAVIHWRGGGQVYQVPGLDAAVTEISWQRSLSDTSEGKIVVSKANATAGCCAALGQVEPWCHELSIYRSGDLVWQGPIVNTVETKNQIEINAEDVTAWLQKLVNYKDLRYSKVDATWIAYDLIRWNLNYAALSTPPDYPHMLPYIRRQDCGSKPGFNKGQWIEYVLDIVRELAKYGFHWTTVGRSLYLRDRLTDTAEAQARLTGHDFIGDLSVTRAGASAVTNAFATNQTADDETGGVYKGTTYIAPTLGTPYGRLDTMVVLQDQDATNAELRTAALAAKGGRYPAPLTIEVPQGAQLSPSAPVTVDQLVCGERIDVILDDYCRAVQQGFRLSEVTGSWTESGEAIGLNLVPLNITAEDEQ